MEDVYVRTGLVVGKFCPLTLGHEFLIAKAASMCQHLIILSYTSENFEKCEAEERARWLAFRFPTASVYVLDPLEIKFPSDKATATAHRQFCAEFLLEKLNTTVQAVFTSEEYGTGFARHLTNYFAENLKNNVPPVGHVLLDLMRKEFRVSGTEVRDSIRPIRWKDKPPILEQLVSSHVRASLVPRIVFLGGESTGKTSLVKAVSAALDTEHVLEYGRAHCESVGGVEALVYEDLEFIGETQTDLERAAGEWVEPGKILVCDTSPLTTSWYSDQLFGRVSTRLQKLAERKYDRYYLCVPDFPFVQDGTRADETFRRAGNEWYYRTLSNAEIEFVPIGGTLEERVALVIQDLREQGIIPWHFQLPKST